MISASSRNTIFAGLSSGNSGDITGVGFGNYSSEFTNETLSYNQDVDGGGSFNGEAELNTSYSKAGIINIDGDITTWGTKVTGDKWLIGVVNPDQKGGISSWIPILESSVATTGGDGNFIMSGNKKYTHIIDPRTGYPATGINSVSVFAKSAETSDALATSIFVMGIDAGLALINQLGDTEVIIVDSANKMHKSNGILLN
jgi:thiamine biosynthesis lipoprotein